MPEIRVEIEMSLLKKLEHLQKEWGVSSSSKLVEILLKELLTPQGTEVTIRKELFDENEGALPTKEG